MAYAPANSSSPNPPFIIAQAMLAGGGSTYNSTVGSSLIGGKLWGYISTHVQTAVGSSDFISDGQKLGMKPGDSVLNMLISGAHSYHRVTAVGSTFASLSAGLVISSAS